MLVAPSAAPLPRLSRHPTLAEYARHWMVRVRTRVRPRTAYLYDFVLTRYLLPTLGAIALAKLVRLDIQHGVVDALLARGLAVATVKSALVVLSAMLADALDDELVDRNVTAGISRKLRARPVRPPTIYTAAQLRLFVTTAEHTVPDLAPLFALCAGAGLRVGEAQGVRGEDLYLDRRMLRVERTIRPGSKVGPPKSGKARVVDLPATCLRLLAPYAGTRGWCFPSPSNRGWPVSYTTVRDTMRRLCTLAKLPSGAPHALRHGYGSTLAAEGVSVEYLRRALGHAATSTTSIYIGHLPMHRPDVLDRL